MASQKGIDLEKFLIDLIRKYDSWDSKSTLKYLKLIKEKNLNVPDCLKEKFELFRLHAIGSKIINWSMLISITMVLFAVVFLRDISAWYDLFYLIAFLTFVLSLLIAKFYFKLPFKGNEHKRNNKAKKYLSHYFLKELYFKDNNDIQDATQEPIFETFKIMSEYEDIMKDERIIDTFESILRENISHYWKQMEILEVSQLQKG